MVPSWPDASLMIVTGVVLELTVVHCTAYSCFWPTFGPSPSISYGSSSSKITAENQRFNSSGSESIPQPTPHQSQASGSSISTSASSAFYSVPGSKASKTADEAEVRGDYAGNNQYGDSLDTDPAAVALRLLRVEDNRNKSSTPAYATLVAKGAPSANGMARQPVYETALDPRFKQREPDQGPDRPSQSPAITLPGPQQQPHAGPLHPVPPLPSPPGVSAALNSPSYSQTTPKLFLNSSEFSTTPPLEQRRHYASKEWL